MRRLRAGATPLPRTATQWASTPRGLSGVAGARMALSPRLGDRQGRWSVVARQLGPSGFVTALRGAWPPGGRGPRSAGSAPPGGTRRSGDTRGARYSRFPRPRTRRRTGGGPFPSGPGPSIVAGVAVTGPPGGRPCRCGYRSAAPRARPGRNRPAARPLPPGAGSAHRGPNGTEHRWLACRARCAEGLAQAAARPSPGHRTTPPTDPALPSGGRNEPRGLLPRPRGFLASARPLARAGRARRRGRDARFRSARPRLSATRSFRARRTGKPTRGGAARGTPPSPRVRARAMSCAHLSTTGPKPGPGRPPAS